MRKKLKEEIDLFLKILISETPSLTNDIKDRFRVIIKKILFFKVVFLSDNSITYLDSMIYSSLMIIRVIFNRNFKQEHYELYLRIFIEHSLKLLDGREGAEKKMATELISYIKLKFMEVVEEGIKTVGSDSPETDKHTYKLICKIKEELYDLNYINKILESLKIDYGDASAALHGGKEKLGNLDEYYSEMLAENKIDSVKLEKVSLELERVLTNVSSLIILIKPEIVDKAFSKNKSSLEYLISKEAYSRFENMIKKQD